MKSKPVSNLVSSTQPSLTIPAPQVVDVFPVEIANLVAVRLLYMNPAVRGTRDGKW